MMIEDLEYIFEPQLKEGTSKLYFMLEDNKYKVVERHPADDLEGLIPMLSNFSYSGMTSNMPKFTFL